MKTIEVNETLQPAYNMAIIFEGLKKRCRNADRHYIEVLRNIQTKEVSEGGGIIRPEIRETIEAMARKVLTEGYKPNKGDLVTVKFQFIEIRKDAGITCRKREPFSGNHLSYTFNF